MSADDGGGPGNREVAYRVFAAEYEDADLSYSESDEERAPNYVVTPTGARVNRLFVVGVLTETEQVNEDVLRARIVDPTGAFVAYAGQYQPDELAFLERADPPMFVALTGKARTFQPEDSDTIYTSVRPEAINEVDAATRDRWVVTTAEQTIDRVATMADALAREERGEDLAAALAGEGVGEAQASGAALALEHYGTTPTYLGAVREMALDAARMVAGERDEVSELTTTPDQEGPTTLSDLGDVDADAVAGPSATADASIGTDETAETETTGTETTDTSTGTETTDTSTGTETTDTSTGTETAETVDATTPDEPTAGADDPAAGADEPTAGADDPPAEPAGSAVEEPVGGEESAGGVATGDTTTGATDGDDDPGDFEPGEFDLDEEEREQVEEEYGTDFETGNTVEEPGEADIETPDPEELAEAESGADAETGADPAAEAEPDAEPETEPPTEPEPETEPPTETDTGTEPDAESEPEPEPEPEPESEPTPDAASTDDGSEASTDDESEPAADAGDVDLEDAVVDVMEELNGDDGAERQAVVDTVVDRHGADPEAVEDAIQDALMGGRCYEPDGETLKPI